MAVQYFRRLKFRTYTRGLDLDILYELFKEDFFEFGNMSVNDYEVSDEQLLSVVNHSDEARPKYSPVVEDILCRLFT